MTLDDIKNYYSSSFNFEKVTGMSHANFVRWKRQGYVPMPMQIKLEALTNGELKASLDNVKGTNHVKPE